MSISTKNNEERFPVVQANSNPTADKNMQSNLTKRRKVRLVPVATANNNSSGNSLNKSINSLSTAPTSSPTLVPTIHNMDLVDIEACIDNPHIAPLGDHVKASSSSSPSSQVQMINQYNNSVCTSRKNSCVTPLTASERLPSNDSKGQGECKQRKIDVITSLSLRRRRLTTSQLENHLSILSSPPIDISGDEKLSSFPLQPFQLVELDLSRNRLTGLPRNLASFCPNLKQLMLGNNLLTCFPSELMELAHLEVLDLSQNKISGPMPEEFPLALSKLKTLKLCSNQITELPSTLSNLKHLQTLTMGSVFGGNLLTSFPSGCISKMPNLVELVLSHNLLKNLPEDIGYPGSKLTRFSALDNKLESIPKSIGLCTQLCSLNLSKNQIASLPVEIADLLELTTLDLSHNLLCIIPGDIADFLSRTTLLLTGNPFTRGDCSNIQSTVNQGNVDAVIADENFDTACEAYSEVVRNLTKQAIPLTAAESDNFDDDAQLDYELYYAQNYFSSHIVTPSISSRSNTPAPFSMEPDSSPFLLGSSSPLRPMPCQSTLATLSSPQPCSFSCATSSATSRPTLIPSLVEQTARTILLNEVPVKPGALPQRLVEYLIHGGRPCSHCHKPYVKQWISSVQIKGYLGHPALLRRIRMCSTKCWNSYLNNLQSSASVNGSSKACQNVSCELSGIRSCWRVKCVLDNDEDCCEKGCVL